MSLVIYYNISSCYIGLTGTSSGCLWIFSLSCDIVINSGAKFNALNWCFLMCHWNLNTTSKLCKSFSSVSIHFCPQILILFASLKLILIPKIVEIAGCNLVSEDHPSNSKHGGVFVYYKKLLLFRVINVKHLQELRIGGEWGL